MYQGWWNLTYFGNILTCLNHIEVHRWWYQNNLTYYFAKNYPVHSKGDQSWVFIGRTDAEAETPILWPPHAKSWLIGKDSDAGRDWGQEEKGKTEDAMAGWHHRLDGRESEWTPGDGDGWGGLACDWTELNRTLQCETADSLDKTIFCLTEWYTNINTVLIQMIWV